MDVKKQDKKTKYIWTALFVLINIAVIALIVLFLSFGAPNQPGSILIGMLMILTYLNISAAISMALCFELFCGGLQNILNVISSVVTVAERESGEKES